MAGAGRVNETLEYLQTFVRFPFALRKFLQHRITLDDAKHIAHERMENREENFMRIVEKSIYGYPRSPYRPLLKMAGCELGDLRSLVKQKGLEDALRELRHAGVYVTYEELKGRKPIVRNGLTLTVNARDFDNPFAQRDFTMTTTGSTGLANQVNQDLDSLINCVPDILLALDIHHTLSAPCGQWSPFLPGPGFRGIFQTIASGRSILKWFAPSGWRDSKYWFRYGLATVYIIFWTRLLGYDLPWPEIVKPDQAIIVARWVAEMLKKHNHCLLTTGVSRALRLCLEAERAGLDLTGLVVRIGSEPLTSAKAAAMQRVGVHPILVYGMAESGHPIAFSCANPTDVSDMHLLKDAFALITYGHSDPNLGFSVPAFNLTSLLDTSPKILFNAQVDDYGIVEDRTCGCGFETFGYTTHVRDILSYGKLVTEGATLVGNDMLRILEQVLPARFGGTMLDYQMSEEEDERGFTSLCLLIHPRVTIPDENAVIEVILDELRQSSPMADAARTTWQNAGAIRVKRKEPVWTFSGKLLPLRIQRPLQK
jgi:hypothetical protein